MTGSDPRRQLNLALHSAYATETEPGVFRFDHDQQFRAISMSLGTLELENTQYAMEEAWSRVFFDEGLRLLTPSERNLYMGVADGDEESDDGVQVSIALPLARNKVSAFRREPASDGVASVTVTTAEAHGVHNLAQLRAHACGLGVALAPSGLALDTAVDIDVVSPTELCVYIPMRPGVEAAVKMQERASNGSLLCGPLAGPAHVASVLNAAANGTGALFHVEGEAVVVTGGVVHGREGVGELLGFPSSGGARSRPRAWAGYASMPVGTYNPGTLTEAYGVAASCIVPRQPDGSRGGVLYIGTLSGKFVPVVLGSAHGYTAAQLGEYITRIADPQIGTGAVTCAVSNGRFSISTSDANPFCISFAGKGSIAASSLGFVCDLYEGSTRYEAEDTLSYPLLGPPGRRREPRLGYGLTIDPATRHVAIAAQRRRFVIENGVAQTENIVPLAAGDLCFLSTHGLVHVARGYPRIKLIMPQEGVVSHAMEVAFEEVSAPSGIVTVAPDALFTLHMQQRIEDRSIRPQILGFNAQTYEPPVHATRAPVRTTVVPAPRYASAGVLALDTAPYVLLELGSLSTNPSTLQRAVLDDGVVISPFAKVCFAPYRTERINPAEVTLPEGNRLGPVFLRIRNPDGTPYNTHGSPFSLSLTITAVQV